MMTHYTEAERKQAEKLFNQHMPHMSGDFSRIGKKVQEIWFNAARKMMRETI